MKKRGTLRLWSQQVLVPVSPLTLSASTLDYRKCWRQWSIQPRHEEINVHRDSPTFSFSSTFYKGSLLDVGLEPSILLVKMVDWFNYFLKPNGCMLKNLIRRTSLFVDSIRSRTIVPGIWFSLWVTGMFTNIEFSIIILVDTVKTSQTLMGYQTKVTTVP